MVLQPSSRPFEKILNKYQGFNVLKEYLQKQACLSTGLKDILVRAKLPGTKTAGVSLW